VAEIAAEAFEVRSPKSIPRGFNAPATWSRVWPKLAAISLFLLGWQAVVWSGWKPDYVLPGPMPVISQLAADLKDPDFYAGVAITMRRALIGYFIAVVVGTSMGILIARVAILRKAAGAAILGLQSMPSITWFPLAILVFQLSESAILFVVVLGAAPAIAGGLLSGVDHVQPLLVRVGRVMGANGLGLYRHIILPAALPSFVGGLKQGWAFAWRSLMAGELIVIVNHQSSLGVRLEFARQFSDAQQLLALMIVIFVIGVAIDSAFGAADAAIRRRWGLSGA
jgi:NitT/TauT family transport system permease protein